MNKKPDNMIYAIILGVLVVVGIISTAIINAVKNTGTAADIRAKAGVTNTLKLTGTVLGIDEVAGTITVGDVQFAAESISGKPVNYGIWSVIPPGSFNLLSATPGANVSFTVNSDSFDVAAKQVAAAQFTVEK